MPDQRPIRIAAAGDLHANGEERERVERAFAELDPQTDIVLLAGDLTGCGDPDEARVLADVCRELQVPVFAVLGNHDWHLNQTHELVSILTDGHVRVLERSTARCEIRGRSVGIVGLKGFVGGFPDYVLPDFGEPLLREVYAETTADVQALDRGLREVAEADVRVVLMHYSPTTTTLEGEPRAIWPFLGSDRLARPIVDHRPDLVVHGHAHAGSFEGFVGPVSVYNVAIHVTGRDFWYFDFDASGRPVAQRAAEARAE
jgi:Icc-related predicted phosphoesterase